MVISLREIAERCFGLHGNFSVLRDLFGYSGNRTPGSTLLTQELIQFRDWERIIFHIKLISTQTWTFTSTVPVDDMIFSMRQVYNNASIAVIVRSTENLALNDTDIDVGQCVTGQVTADQTTLFNNRNSVGQNEIVVYIVRAVLGAGGGMFAGCATFPAGRPGAVVASTGTRWTLSHEVGHILVGPHIETASGQTCPTDLMPPQLGMCQLTNVMTCCGTFMIAANTVPVFNTDQIQRIIDSDLTRRCGA